MISNNSRNVKEFYTSNIENLKNNARRHFLSRMYLWFKLGFYKKLLVETKSEYIGNTTQDILKMLKKLYQYTPSPYIRQKEQREKYIEIYKKVIVNNRVLAKNLFSQTLYDLDISEAVINVIDIEDLKSFYNSIKDQRQAIATLATTVVNLTYFLKFFFQQQPHLKFPLLTNEFFLEIFNSEYKFEEDWEVEIAIYLLTHIIIGESYFYKISPRKSTINLDVLDQLHKLIASNYDQVSLDNKLEYLVCCRLTSEKSDLYERIIKEAKKNIINNSYLVDPYNFHLKNSKDPFSKLVEHTNSLYIMATNSFAQNEKHY